MTLQGKNACLDEGIAPASYDLLLRWFNDLEVVGYLRNAWRMSQFATAKEVGEYLKEEGTKKDTLFFGVYECDKKQLIGYALLANLRNRQAEFGLIIGDKAYWGSGVSLEVSTLLLDYSFNELGLLELYLTTAEYNLRASHFFQKLGFHMIKTTPDDRVVCHKNEWTRCGTMHMALKKQEYLAL